MSKVTKPKVETNVTISAITKESKNTTIKPAKETVQTKLPKEEEVYSVFDYNPREQLKFGPVEIGDIPSKNGKPAGKYYRVPIYSVNKEGKTQGGANVKFPKMFCFGVQENQSQDGGEVSGYSYALCLFNRAADGGPTEEQKKAKELLEEASEMCREHIMTIKDEIGQKKLEKAELRKVNPISDEKNPDEPKIYPKLISSKPKTDEKGEFKEGKIYTNFYDDWDENDPEKAKLIEDKLSLVSTPEKKAWHHSTPIIRLESIYIGGVNRKLQLKVTEAGINRTNYSAKGRSLMFKPSKKEQVMLSNDNTSNLMKASVEENTSTTLLTSKESSPKKEDKKDESKKGDDSKKEESKKKKKDERTRDKKKPKEDELELDE